MLWRVRGRWKAGHRLDGVDKAATFLPIDEFAAGWRSEFVEI
jgi:hypothetical protein